MPSNAYALPLHEGGRYVARHAAGAKRQADRHGSISDRATPRASSSAKLFTKCRNERPQRSSFHTSTTSHLRLWTSETNLFNSGRLSLAPLAISTYSSLMAQSRRAQYSRSTALKSRSPQMGRATGSAESGIWREMYVRMVPGDRIAPRVHTFSLPLAA